MIAALLTHGVSPTTVFHAETIKQMWKGQGSSWCQIKNLYGVMDQPFQQVHGGAVHQPSGANM